MKRKPLVILLALLLDWSMGDPPNQLHPVAWMGKAIAWGEKCCQLRQPWAQFGQGALLALVEGAGVILLVSWLKKMLAALPAPISIISEALLLKMTFSGRGLHRAAGDVERALQQGDIAAARHWLSWHLVSRDVSQLGEDEIAAATIESLAENASDGLVAPWFWYMLAGLPAAYFYRFANTADAMLGYRDARREWLGKFPARLDDALNLIPARLTALLIIAASWFTRGDGARAWRVWRRDARLTASPNAGHPMSAMAGALGVRLEKRENYTLGAEFPPPGQTHLARSRQMLSVIILLAAGFTILVTFRSRD